VNALAMDLGKLLELGFKGFKDKQAIKILWCLLAVNVVSALLIYSAYVSLGISGLLGSSGDILFLVINFFYFLGIAVVIGTLTSLANLFFSAKTKLIVLKKFGFKPKELTLSRFINLILLYFAGFFVALLSLFRPKYLFALLLAAISMVLGFMQNDAVFAVIGFLILVFYLAVVLFNSIKLAFGDAIFLSSGKDIMQSLRESDNKTKGKVIELFIALIVIGFISGIVSSIAGAVGGFSVVASMEYPILSGILTAIVESFLIIFANFYLIGLFVQLLKPKRKK
jgi:hypothetical protein